MEMQKLQCFNSNQSWITVLQQQQSNHQQEIQSECKGCLLNRLSCIDCLFGNACDNGDILLHSDSSKHISKLISDAAWRERETKRVLIEGQGFREGDKIGRGVED